MSGIMEVKVIRRRATEPRPVVTNSVETVTAKTTNTNSQVCPEREKCKELLDTVIRGLVDYPETINVSYSVGERTTIFKVDCDQRCLGQIIGSKGKNISGVRAVIAATMARKGIRAIVEIPYFCLET
jgi:predicted RNA-binding protein YlqC (UPF0109 family)